MKSKIVLSLTLFAFSLFAKASNCDITFNVDDGKKYDISQLSDFVVKEIRPLLSEKDKFVDINIKQKCYEKNDDIKISMNTRSYYLLNINGQELPDHIVKYNNRLSMDLNEANLRKVIAATNSQNFAKYQKSSDAKTYNEMKEQSTQQLILKMYAFVLAETARFESAEIALTNAFSKGCSIDWHDFDFAVHNWSNMTGFVKSQNLKTDTQYEGKGLIAPITLEQEKKFIEFIGDKVSSKDKYSGHKFSKSAQYFEYDYEC